MSRRGPNTFRGKEGCDASSACGRACALGLRRFLSRLSHGDEYGKRILGDAAYLSGYLDTLTATDTGTAFFFASRKRQGGVLGSAIRLRRPARRRRELLDDLLHLGANVEAFEQVPRVVYSLSRERSLGAHA